MSSILQAISEALADAVERARRGLVQLHDGSGSIGAGTVWDAGGLIITNAHVVLDGGGRWRDGLHASLPDGRSLPVQPVAHDSGRDLAALQVAAEGLEALRPAPAHSLRPGQWVMALGHPWGLPDALTAGVVIGTGAQLPERFDGREWLALDLQLRPGHSGGPLLDSEGRLVGINTLITGPEVGFAIPVHVVSAFLQEALQPDVI